MRGCSTSIKYWQPSTSWRICQMLFYFYHIRKDNKLTIRWEVVLLLRNADIIQQVPDYVRGCSTAAKYWQPSTNCRLGKRLLYFYKILTSVNKLKIMSEVVLLLRNTDSLQQAEDMSDDVLLLRNTDGLQLVDNYVWDCSTSTDYWQPSKSWRWCQMLLYFKKILTAFNKLENMSDVVLHLSYTDNL